MCPPAELVELTTELTTVVQTDDSMGGPEEALLDDFGEHQEGEDIASRITESAIASAINLTEVCCQHAAYRYMAGRQNLEDEIKIIKECK